MAHHISRNLITGKQEAYFAEQPAWHRLGTVAPEAMESSAVIEHAGLDWTVEQVPLPYEFVTSIEQTAAVVEGRNPVPTKVETGLYANCRNDTAEHLGTVAKRYKIFQNTEAFSFMDLVIGAQAKAGQKVVYESAGALKGGRIVWLLARLPDLDYSVKGDEQRQYMLLANGHDGKFGFVMKQTDVRVVCWNTLSWALSSTLRKRHTGKSLTDTDVVKGAQDLFGAATNRAKKEAEVNTSLAGTALTNEMVRDYLDAIQPLPEGPQLGMTDLAAKKAKQELERIDKIRQKIVNNLLHPTNTTQATANTAYGLLNAATYWADHQRNGSEDGQLASSWFGDSAKFKEKARNQAVAVLLNN